jgi:flagellar hook protein FlgE
MSLMSSMYTGVSGMETNSVDLTVIGDNIANANTIGFKAGRAAFEDALAQNLIGGGGSVGWGARVQAVQRLITQGALTNTGLATDLAIQGGGFFMVRGNHAGMDGQYYTRAGQFTVNRDGDLVNLEGLAVQGYQADAAGNITGALGNLRIGDASSQPSATQNITMRGNLQESATPPALPFDPTSATTAAATSNFSSPVTIYDSLGAAHQTTVYFVRTAAGWDWHALTDGGGITGGTAGTPVEIAAGDLTFDTAGALVTSNTTVNNFNPINAVNPQPVTFNFGDPTALGGTGLAGMTGNDSPSTNRFISQDGYAAGDLARIAIGTDGTVTGTFSNGQTRDLGQVALAQFEAADRLDRLGGNLFGASAAAGDLNIGRASTGGRGAINAGTLEQSNVDLATEFVRMIAAQRGFQANSKTITTADQLLSELIQLKR